MLDEYMKNVERIFIKCWTRIWKMFNNYLKNIELLFVKELIGIKNVEWVFKNANKYLKNIE